jgi:hypothetical protein
VACLAVSANLLYGFGHVNLQIRVVIVAQYFARLVSWGLKERWPCAPTKLREGIVKLLTILPSP